MPSLKMGKSIKTITERQSHRPTQTVRWSEQVIPKSGSFIRPYHGDSQFSMDPADADPFVPSAVKLSSQFVGN